MVSTQLIILVIVLVAGYFVMQRFRARPESTETDFVIESIELDPPDGSTIPEQTPVIATIQFRFTKPAGRLGIWVRIFDETYPSTYFGSQDRFEPGTHRVQRGGFLTEPGVLNCLTVVVKNSASAEVFRQDIPVNYTFVRDPALDALKKEGAGSTITAITFLGGKEKTIRKGGYVDVNVGYNITTPNGLIASVIPETTCSMTYAGLTEPLKGTGEVALGFAIGEACVIKRVRVILRNEAQGVIDEQFVDVNLTVTD